MIQTLRSSPIMIVFWLISAAALGWLWRFLPNAPSEIAVLLLLFLVVIATLLRQTDLPVLTTIFLSLTVINYFTATHSRVPALVGSLVVAIVVPALGLSAEKISQHEQLLTGKVWSDWILLGLLLAESNAVFSLWPVSFFTRSLLSGIFFYAYWQLFRLPIGDRRHLIAHFVLAGLAVILVIGIIIWANVSHSIAL